MHFLEFFFSIFIEILLKFVSDVNSGLGNGLITAQDNKFPMS